MDFINVRARKRYSKFMVISTLRDELDETNTTLFQIPLTMLWINANPARLPSDLRSYGLMNDTMKRTFVQAAHSLPRKKHNVSL